MTISHDPDMPVYFFCPDHYPRQVLEGRFLKVAAFGAVVVTVNIGGMWPVEHYYSSEVYAFTNDFKEAKRSGIKYLKGEAATKRDEVKQLYKEIVKLSWSKKP